MTQLRQLTAQSVVAAVGQLSAFFLENYVTMGPIFRFERAGEEYTVISGPEANLFITREGKRHIRADEYRKAQNDELGIAETLVSANGEAHERLRTLQQSGYSRAALDDRYPELVGITRDFVRRWRPGERLLVRDVMPRIIAEQLGVGVINHPLGDHFDDIVLWVRTLVIETVARTRPRTVLDTPEYHRARDRAMALADEVIASHRRAGTETRAPDLVDDLLSALAADGDLMSTQELRVAVLGGYIGGLDTVAYTCAFMLYALLRYPDVLARVQAEIDAVFDAGPPTPAALRGMTALRHATMETLRLYPVSPAIQATVAEPFEFAGCRVERGSNLILGATVPHLLPYFYADPFRFDIERYSPPRDEHRQPGVYAPFGLGPHTCLGAGMAGVLIMLTMGTLLHTVRLELDPPDSPLTIRPIPSPAPVDLHVRVVEQRRRA